MHRKQSLPECFSQNCYLKLLFKAFLLQPTWLWTELLRMSGLKLPSVLLEDSLYSHFFSYWPAGRKIKTNLVSCAGTAAYWEGPGSTHHPSDLPLNQRQNSHKWPSHKLCMLTICKTHFLPLLGVKPAGDDCPLCMNMPRQGPKGMVLCAFTTSAWQVRVDCLLTEEVGKSAPSAVCWYYG